VAVKIAAAKLASSRSLRPDGAAGPHRLPHPLIGAHLAGVDADEIAARSRHHNVRGRGEPAPQLPASSNSHQRRHLASSPILNVSFAGILAHKESCRRVLDCGCSTPANACAWPGVPGACGRGEGRVRLHAAASRRRATRHRHRDCDVLTCGSWHISTFRRTPRRVLELLRRAISDPALSERDDQWTQRGARKCFWPPSSGAWDEAVPVQAAAAADSGDPAYQHGPRQSPGISRPSAGTGRGGPHRYICADMATSLQRRRGCSVAVRGVAEAAARSVSFYIYGHMRLSSLD